MNVEYINPFIEASKSVLKQIAGIDATLGKVYLKNSPYSSENIIIIVGLTGKIRGQAVFNMTRSVAVHIASKMMSSMTVESLDEILISAVSELANMILGNTATLLYNRGIDIEITPPSFLTGQNIQISPNKMKTICIPLQFDNMNMDIDLSVENG